MAPLASFAGLAWLACSSPAPPKRKKPSPSPAPTKQAASASPPKPVERRHNTNLWTQTPPGGILTPPPPVYDEIPSEKPAEKPKSKAKNNFRFWKRFYREFPWLLERPYSSTLWGGLGTDGENEEPKRSKFWRKELRKYPGRLRAEYVSPWSDDEASDSEYDSNTDNDGENNGGYSSDSSSSRESRRFRHRRETIERREKGLSQQVASQEQKGKHVHFPDEEEKLKSILKNKEIVVREEAAFNSSEPVKEDTFQDMRIPEVNVNVICHPTQLSASDARVTEEERAKPEQKNNAGHKNTKFIDRRQVRSSEPSPADRQQSSDNTLCSTPNYSISSQYFQYSDIFPHVSQHQHFQRGVPQLTQSPSYGDVGYYSSPFCFNPPKPEFENWFNPLLGCSIQGKMESTSAKTRCILPVSAHVMIVEHLLEIPTDPRPNAFYDARTGCLRVYHGNVYGNPNGSLLPVHTEQMLSSHLGTAGMADNGFGVFPPGGATFTALQPGSHGPIPCAPVGPFVMGPQPATQGSPPYLVRGINPTMSAAMYPGMNAAMGMGQGVAFSAYNGGMQGMGMNNMNNMNNMSNINNRQSNSPGFTSPPYLADQPHNNNGGGNFGKGNSNGGGNNNNRNFSANSSNWNQNQSQNQNNRSQNRNQNRNNRGSQSDENNKNNWSSNSDSGNAGGGGGNSWDNNNNSGNAAPADDWNNNNNSGNAAPADDWNNNDNKNKNNKNNNNGTSDPVPAVSAPPSSPTPAVVQNVTNDPFSSGLVVDLDTTPTKEHHAHIPGAFPESTHKNSNNNSSWDTNNNNNNKACTSNVNDDWDSGFNNAVSANVNDDWDSGFNANNNTFGRTDETVLSAGSWKSPPPTDQKENKNQGYNLRQTNANNTKQGWGDKTAAQTTGGAGGW